MMMVYTYEVTVWSESEDGNPNGDTSTSPYSIFADSNDIRIELLDFHLTTPNYTQLKKAVLTHARTLTLHEMGLLSERAVRSGVEIRHLPAWQLIDPRKPNHGISKAFLSRMAA
jgi:hypothetical protein